MRMTQQALARSAAIRGRLAEATLAIREAGRHLNAGNHERLIVAAIALAQSALADAASRAGGPQ